VSPRTISLTKRKRRDPIMRVAGGGFVIYQPGQTARRPAGMDHAQWQLCEVCGYGRETRHPIIELQEGPREVEICGAHAASQIAKADKITIQWHHHGAVLEVLVDD